MKYLKIALLAGVLASASSMAFAQAGAPTGGVDFRSVHGSNAAPTRSARSTSAGKRHRTRAVTRTTTPQSETNGSGIVGGGGVGSPD
jgi:hypothetical protein